MPRRSALLLDVLEAEKSSVDGRGPSCADGEGCAIAALAPLGFCGRMGFLKRLEVLRQRVSARESWPCEAQRARCRCDRAEFELAALNSRARRPGRW